MKITCDFCTCWSMQPKPLKWHGARRGVTSLDQDRPLNLSLVRLLEIVGEAAGRVTIETRRRYPNIPWQDIVGLRNRLIHGYEEWILIFSGKLSREICRH